MSNTRASQPSPLAEALRRFFARASDPSGEPGDPTQFSDDTKAICKAIERLQGGRQLGAAAVISHLYQSVATNPRTFDGTTDAEVLRYLQRTALSVWKAERRRSGHVSLDPTGGDGPGADSTVPIDPQGEGGFDTVEQEDELEDWRRRAVAIMTKVTSSFFASAGDDGPRYREHWIRLLRYHRREEDLATILGWTDALGTPAWNTLRNAVHQQHKRLRAYLLQHGECLWNERELSDPEWEIVRSFLAELVLRQNRPASSVPVPATGSRPDAGGSDD